MFSASTKKRRTPLAVQLWAVLAFAAIGLSFVIGEVVTDSERRSRRDDLHRTLRRSATALARRAAPLLDRADDLRLAVLTASVADVSGARVLLLDKGGVVRLDTGLSLGGRRLEIESSDGLVERSIAADDSTWEVVAPVLANSGFVGEVRLRYRGEAYASSVPFAWNVLGASLLGALTLVVLAWWIVHHWILQLRASVVQIRAIGRESGIADHVADESHGEALTEIQAAAQSAQELVQEERRRGREAGLELARRLVKALEKHGRAVTGHGERTRRYALMLAEAAAMPSDEWEELEIAASLVDLGKAAVRQSALTKGGELSDIERESLRHAPGRGAGLLHGLPLMDRIASAVRHHHEKYDGTGYPDGLRGERIPLASRIIAIADAYDLLTSDTSCGDGLRWPDALERMHEDRGEHFDPTLLDLFEEEIRRNPAPNRSDRPLVLEASNREMPYKLAEEEAPEARRTIDVDEISVDDVVAQFGDMEFEVLFDESVSGSSPAVDPPEQAGDEESR